jgi:hypothetical protein
MKNHMHERKLHNHLGPGGRDCPCCGPNPSYRKQHDRMIKRRIRQHTQRDIALEASAIDDLRAA